MRVLAYAIKIFKRLFSVWYAIYTAGATREVEILLIMGYDAEENNKMMENRKIKCFLKKPLQKEKVISRITEILGITRKV